MPPISEACSNTVTFVTEQASKFAAAQSPAGPAPMIPTDESFDKNDFLKNQIQN